MLTAEIIALFPELLAVKLLMSSLDLFQLWWLVAAPQL
jgi:hypothetical protein